MWELCGNRIDSEPMYCTSLELSLTTITAMCHVQGVGSQKKEKAAGLKDVVKRRKNPTVTYSRLIHSEVGQQQSAELMNQQTEWRQRKWDQ